MLKSYWRYFLYVLNHKINVFIECWKEGLYVQGITHDLSKFSPSEFFPYARKFYSDKDTDETEWQYAWLHHQHKNKHHWHYWVVDPHQRKAVPIPRKYLLEMICDYRSFSRKWGKKNVKTGDLSNHISNRLLTSLLGDEVILHSKTKEECETLIPKKLIK